MPLPSKHASKDQNNLAHVMLGGGLSAFQPSSSLQVGDDEIPRRSFVKDLISEGIYVHPAEGWTMDVTPGRMDRWIAAFRLMRDNGVDVEVVKDHSFKADDGIGKVVDMYRGPNDDGKETLFAVHELVGDDAIELAARVQNVSVWVDHAFTDGKGTFYGEAILHSSIVQQPVVPNQQGFVPVAAGRRKVKAASLVLQQETQTMTIEELMAKAKEMLGAGDDLTVDNLFERLHERLLSFGTEKEETDKKLLDLTATNETLTKSVADLEAKAAGRAPDKDEPKVDPDAIEMLAEGTQAKVASLVDKGKLSPKAAEALSLALVGEAGKRNVRALSRVAAGGDEPIAKTILAALELNEIVEITEMTGYQALSRQSPGEDAKPNEGVVSQMVTAGGGAEPKPDQK